MAESKKQAAAAATTTAKATDQPLLDQMIDQFRPQDQDERATALEQLDEFVRQLMLKHPGARVAKDTVRTINTWIAELDQKLTSQLNEVIHQEEFQKLEASWRGLHYLVKNSETGTNLKIRVLQASKQDLLNDLETASEFDQSSLFKKVYTEEYDQFGGHPYGVLIGDYEFGRGGQDLALLERVAEVAADAHAPFMAAAAPTMFGLESFADIGRPRDLAKIFDTTEYVKWRSFRDSEDSRYVGLTLPHTLMRLPYGKGDNEIPVSAFNFQEDVTGKDHKKYLWGNAAWALGARITDSFAKCGWLATIRGVQNGGLVEGLPVHTFATDEGEVAMKCPTEIAISERREHELAKLGFITLVHCKNTDYAAFFSTQSCQKPKVYDKPEATASARLSCALQYLLCVSRFAHYLKAIARDKIGSFMERQECETWLNRWINNYTLATPENVGEEGRAERPLREARIDVREDPSRPGCYEAVAYMRPHFQLEELDINLSLVAKLPESQNK